MTLVGTEEMRYDRQRSPRLLLGCISTQTEESPPSPHPTPTAPFWQPLLDLNEMLLDVQRHMRVLPGIGETYEVKDKRAHMAA